MPKAVILIIDDQTANLKLLASSLSGDYTLSMARTAQAALNILETVHPDLILLDVHLPDMDGYTLCQQLKSTPTTREIPVLFMTGNTSSEGKELAYAAGGVDFFAKPFYLPELLTRINTHIQAYRYRSNASSLRVLAQNLVTQCRKLRETHPAQTDANLAPHIATLEADINELQVKFKEMEDATLANTAPSAKSTEG